MQEYIHQTTYTPNTATTPVVEQVRTQVVPEATVVNPLEQMRRERERSWWNGFISGLLLAIFLSLILPNLVNQPATVQTVPVSNEQQTATNQ